MGSTVPAPHQNPRGHGPEHVALALPTVLPTVPAGHCTCVGLVLAKGQKWPTLHGPLHAGDPNPCVSPYTPAGQGTALVEVEAGGV